MRHAPSIRGSALVRRTGRSRKKEGGYSIVELLVVIAILGGVMAAVLSLFNMQSRTAHVQEDVARVQQDLRGGLDRLTRDLRVLSLGIAGPVSPVNAIGNGTGLGGTDTIRLNTASVSGRYARVDALFAGTLTPSIPITLTAGSSEEASLFAPGAVVRILNPAERGEVVNVPFTVSSVDTAAPSVTLMPGGTSSDVRFEKGFIMALSSESAPDTFPGTVEYCVGPSATCGSGVTTCLSGNCLFRVRNGVATNDSVVAKNIQDFQLRYILDGATAEADTPSDPQAVRAVRVTLTGRNFSTDAFTEAPKTRELTTGTPSAGSSQMITIRGPKLKRRRLSHRTLHS